MDVYEGRGKRKKLRRLKDVAACNVAQYLSCHSDVDDLEVPISLRNLVKPFVIKISGDNIFDLNETEIKIIVKCCRNLYPFDPVVCLAIFHPPFYILSRMLFQLHMGRTRWQKLWAQTAQLLPHKYFLFRHDIIICKSIQACY